MEFGELAATIIQLKNDDLALRDKLVKQGILSAGYNKEMAILHLKNAEILNGIIERIGYPTIDKVGKQGSEAAWLVIQHSIGNPEFMRKCAKLLAIAVDDKKANPINLAYLKDRIAVFEGKPQLYGTQFDWDEHGELSPKPFDKIDLVNARRKSIGLNTLQEQTEIIRERAIRENEHPPKDYFNRKSKMEEWKKSVGWI